MYTEMDGGFDNGTAVRRNGLGVGAVSPALLSDTCVRSKLNCVC